MTPMSDTVKQQIQALVDRATLGLNIKNADLLLDIIHPAPFPSRPFVLPLIAR